MRQFQLMVFLIFSFQMMSQTGIGTTTPHASAKLEVNATDKGFLPPRVTLTSSSDNSTIPNPATGLLVYNTGTNAGLRAGYYYWNGTDWTTIATASSPDQMVDYIQASLSANQTLSAAGNVNFNTSSGTGITITSGGFQLQANKTYKLEAALGGSSTGYGYYTWVDNTNAILPGSSIGVIMKAGAAFTDAPQDKAVVYYTPTANTTVYLRVINISGSIIAYAPSTVSGYSSTWASIQQVGSSAFVNPWVLSGNDVYNNTGKVGIGTTTPTSKLNIAGGGIKIATGFGNSTNRPSLNTSTIGNYEIRGVGGGTPQIDGQDDGFLRLSAGGGTSVNTQSSIDLSGYSTVADMSSTILMRTGGAERLRIDPNGNVNITGKLNVGDPSGNVVTKASGLVNAGTFVQLDNLKATVPTSGLRSLSIATVSGSFAAYINASYTLYTGGVNGTGTTLTVTTTPVLALNWNFGGAGDTINYTIVDTTNGKAYRIMLMIGPGYTNNFISIERLL